MSSIIEDGSGDSHKAKVDNTNKLATRSVSESPTLEAMGDGRAFRVGSGIITLTSANESAILYFKNNDSRDILIYEIVNVIGASTGGSGATTTGFKLNPTGGTIQANTAAITINLNAGSNNIADITATVGDEGKTALGNGGSSIFPVTGRLTLENQLILPKGTDLSLSVTPPTSNTSQKVQMIIKFYFIEKV